MRKVALNLLICLAAYCSSAVSAAAQSLCGPVLESGIIFYGYECMNDSSALVIPGKSFNWKYAYDSKNDGVNGGEIGDEYEMFGIAIREFNDEVWIVVNGNMSYAGFANGGALNGSVSHGDLFLNFSGLNFVDASNAKALYGIRFASSNDSGAPQLGVYKNVSAKSVTGQNNGFATLSDYETAVSNRGGTVNYGDLPISQSYYAKTISSNVIDQGSYLGPITLLASNDLLTAGFDMTAYGGFATIAFKFSKSLIIDQCGVWGGDGKSCLDCRSVPCGTAVIDQCNICGGDGKSCLDCAGTPFGSKVTDQCGVCGGDGKSCLDCAGTPFGNKQLDQCGVCGGDGTSCLDCAGNPNGGKKFDICGVCGGDGSSCLDCAGVPFGGKVTDQCGICGGDGKSCLDCAGTPFGDSKYDQCGICGGNGKSCLDCKGVPNGSAKLDRCNVCEGDGTSCLDCSQSDIGDQLVALDGGSLDQRNDVWRASRVLEKAARGNKKLLNFAKLARTKADELHIRNWELSWSIPRIIVKCANTQFCASVRHDQPVGQYLVTAEELLALTNKLLKTARKVSGDRKLGARVARQARSNFVKVTNLADGVPTSSTVCTKG